ncbi:hypothetical protein NDU88_004639, partial [Pleurodeles waltl]
MMSPCFRETLGRRQVPSQFVVLPWPWRRQGEDQAVSSLPGCDLGFCPSRQ